MEKSVGSVYQIVKKFAYIGKISFIDMELSIVKTVDKKRIFYREYYYPIELQDFINSNYMRCLNIILKRVQNYKYKKDYREFAVDQCFEKIIKDFFVIEFINFHDKRLPVYYEAECLKREIDFCYKKGIVAFHTWREGLNKKLSKYNLIFIFSLCNRKFVLPSTRLYKIIYNGFLCYGITISPDLVILLSDNIKGKNKLIQIYDNIQIEKINKAIYSYESKKDCSYLIGLAKDLAIIMGKNH